MPWHHNRLPVGNLFAVHIRDHGRLTGDEYVRECRPGSWSAFCGLKCNYFEMCGEVGDRLDRCVESFIHGHPGTSVFGEHEFVDEFIYPEPVGSKAVINYVQDDDIRTLEDVTDDLDVLDIRVDTRSPVAGKQLKEILFPDSSQVISDADGTDIARPETILDSGRRYLVAAEPSVADDVHKPLVD